MNWHLGDDPRLLTLADLANRPSVEPIPDRSEATIRKRRIGYTVTRTGPWHQHHGDTTWHPTRRAARRAANKWVRPGRPAGRLVERIKGPRT